jgi:hypothetical protein
VLVYVNIIQPVLPDVKSFSKLFSLYFHNTQALLHRPVEFARWIT